MLILMNGHGGDLGKTGIPKNGREGLFNSYYKNGNPEAINPKFRYEKCYKNF
jgi:hypothetical protein